MVELWIIVGLAGSFAVGLFNLYQKYVIERGQTPLQVITGMHLVASVLLLSTLLFAPVFFSVKMALLLVASGIINGISFWLLAIAYEQDSLSLIAPLRGVTPIFVAFFEPIVFQNLNYKLSLVFSSFVVAFGIYILLYEDSFVAPLKRLSDRGVSRGVISAIIIAFAVLIDRYAIVNTGVEPVTYSMYLMIAAFVSSFIISVHFSESRATDMLIPDAKIIPLGFLRALYVVLAFTTLSLVEGTRFTIIWQIGTMIAAIAGGSLLNEDDLVRKSIGAGMILIAVFVAIVV